MACIMGAVPWWGLPVNWIIGMHNLSALCRSPLEYSTVTFGNLTGSLFVAGVLVKGPHAALDSTHALIPRSYRYHIHGALLDIHQSLCDVNPILTLLSLADLPPTAHRKKAVDPEWHQIFLRGIGCNWLVCVAVWVSVALE